MSQRSGEQELDSFTSLAIDMWWLLRRTQLFPLIDALAHQGMNRLRVAGRRLVHRNIQEADCVFW